MGDAREPCTKFSIRPISVILQFANGSHKSFLEDIVSHMSVANHEENICKELTLIASQQFIKSAIIAGNIAQRQLFICK